MIHLCAGLLTASYHTLVAIIWGESGCEWVWQKINLLHVGVERWLVLGIKKPFIIYYMYLINRSDFLLYDLPRPLLVKKNMAPADSNQQIRTRTAFITSLQLETDISSGRICEH